MSLLFIIILLPILAAIGILLGAPAKSTAITSSVLGLVLTLVVAFGYDPAASGYQFTSALEILPQLDLKFFLGVDGLSILMLLLAAIVTLAAVAVAQVPEKSPNQFFACLLLISAGAIGAFASLDLFFFYAFHELALIPTFLLIGIWGSGDRYAAAWKITIYLALGSIVLLVGLIGLYQAVPLAERTFDIPKLQAMAADGGLIGEGGNWIYLCTLLGFGILVSLFPFHTWAPQAYASAPTPATMLHAGILKKFGLYGLLRIALPIMPEQVQAWTNLLLLLLIGNILYVGLATIAQKRLDMMLGYSSVMHMGYIFLGIAAFDIIGTSGAALLLFAHGLSIAALFAMSGEIKKRTETLTFSELGGLAKVTPFMGLAFGFATFASIGLPGFANFASEVMVFFGAFSAQGAESHNSNFQLVTIGALWGVVISAVYMLRGYRAVFMGESGDRWNGIADLSAGTRWPLILLIATLLLAGFFPQLFLNFVTPSLEAILPF